MVDHLLHTSAQVSGVIAAPPLAEAFTASWISTAGGIIERIVHQRIYRLTAVFEFPTPMGELRRATAADTDLVGDWFAAFDREALGENDNGAAWRRADGRISEGAVYLWEDTEPRSVAARARPTRRSITINAVYTPHAWRRRAFATAAVAH